MRFSRSREGWDLPMRWIVAALVAAGLAAAAFAVLQLRGGGGEDAVVLPQDPMPGRLLVGLEDDASFRWASDRPQMLDAARAAHAAVIRTTVDWARVAPTRPVHATNPFAPAYRFDEVDDLVRNGQQRGLELLITIWGTPSWANGGQSPNHAPTDPNDLEEFAHAVADRYSGRHAGYPSVRLYSAWNEPNLEQFLAPQFDEEGDSVGPAIYAPIARAVYDGVKQASPDALVAIGETSPRGHDTPSRGTVQDSHSPVRFARLLSEQRPKVRFDAWAQHPYPARSGIGPSQAVRWPRVGFANLERFGESLDEWFGRDDIPLWLTEYGHETAPDDPAGVTRELQASYAQQALALAANNPRVRMLVWFIVRDRRDTLWQSGLFAADGSAKPALSAFTEAARRADARNPVLPADAEVAQLSALELAYHAPAGSHVGVEVAGRRRAAVPLRADGWIEVPLDARRRSVLEVRATDEFGQSVSRTVRFGPVD
jgi:Cellulase (glycosyl hydrolase family 5)